MKKRGNNGEFSGSPWRLRAAASFCLRLGLVICAWLGGLSGAKATVSDTNAPVVVVVVGAGGEEEYAEGFAEWSKAVRKAAEKGAAELWEIGLTNAPGVADMDRLRELLGSISVEAPSTLWILLVGHGTYDGREARFNLKGPDLTATELGLLLDRVRRPVVIVNCASSSGAFLKPLGKAGRIVVTSTKSGFEQNYSRFGSYFTSALVDLKADLDKDRQVSLLEAFLYASAGVREFYKGEQRLASEHALIDDNGDGLGTPADWFRGVQASQKSKGDAVADGRRAHQFHLVMSNEERGWEPARIARRDELELQVWNLKDRKSAMSEAEYYADIEKLLIQLARVNEAWTNAAK